MSVFQKFQPFVKDLAEGVHNLGSNQLKVALTNIAPVVTNRLLGDITEIAYTNLSTRNVVTASSSQVAGIYKLVLNDLTLTASGGAVAGFRYIVLYNDTPAGKNLIGFFDYGTTLNLADTESLLIDFDGTGALTLN